MPGLFSTTKPAPPRSPDEPPLFPPNRAKQLAPLCDEPPPFPPKQGAHSAAGKSIPAGPLGAEPPSTKTSGSRLPQVGVPGVSAPRKQNLGLKELAIIGGCAMFLFGLVCVALLSGTSGKPVVKGGSFPSHSSPAGPSSSLPVPAVTVTDRDGLRRALEEGDRLWDSGQRSQAMTYYAAAMECPDIIEIKDTVMERMFPRMMQYFTDEKNEAGLDKMIAFTVEKGIRLRSPDPATQEYLDGWRAHYLTERINRQFQELGIPIPEGPVTQDFIDGVNEGLAQARGMVATLRNVENLPPGVIPVVREESRQKQVDLCLNLLNGLDQGNAEIANGIRAQGGDPGPALQRRLGIAAGLRAAFRKAGIVP